MWKRSNRINKILFWSIAISWALLLYDNLHLRARIEVLEELVDLQAHWCAGLAKVNEVCEGTLVDLGSRLGLDKEWMPLVNTALWRRAAQGEPIAGARKRLGASPGMPDAPMSGMGGPAE